MAATTEDLARLLVSIEFTQRQSAKQLAAIAKAGGDSAKQIEDRFQKANDNVGKSFDAGGKRATAAMRQSSAAVANLSFQLNDIAMGLASGTSPFTIMVQQGSQVAQVFNGSGGGLVGAVKTLGGAFAQMVNPVSLASFAIIGLGGALVQYLTTLGSGMQDQETLLKEHRNLIKSFDEAWGIAERGAKRYSEATKVVELQKLKDQFGDLSKTAEGTFDEVTHGLRQIAASEFGSGDLIDQTAKAMQLLDKEIPAVKEFAAEMVKIENTKDAPLVVREAAKEARLLAQGLFPVQDALEEIKKRLNTLRLSGDEAKAMLANLTSFSIGLGTHGSDAIGDIAGKIKTDLIPAMSDAIGQVATFVNNFASLQQQVNQTPLGMSPVFSGGGQFLNSDGDLLVSPFNANEGALRAAGESAAAKMIRGFENFISSAKWDVNAFRTGYGSDTTTRANGAIEKVTKDTVVSLDDAERDLSRRIIEFQDGIQKAIGVDTWRSLNEAQQAALTSIAYNYGSLPKSIVAAIEGGGGPEVVAKAIAGLTANPGRRKEEAQAYLSGTGYSMGDVGLGNKKSPKDIFQGDIDQIQKRIDVLNAEYEAQAKLNPLVNDYGYAVEKARIEQELLSEAQKAGLEITPALRADIGTLAENYAKAAAASDQLKESQKKAVESAQEFASLGKDVTKGFISDLRSGKSAAEAFAGALDTIADKLINLAIDGLFGGFGAGGLGGGGLLGGAIIPGILHGGGVAGSDGYGHGRAVSAGTFAGAKRYHKGGQAGLMPGEIPAILQRGEVVLPRGTKAGGGQAVHVTVGVSADGNGNLLPFVQDVSKKTVTEAAPKIVGAANQNVVPTMAKYQGQKAGGDYRTM